MIAANVAAAKALEAKKAPVMYRVHEPPSREKLVALKDYLKTFGDRVRARPGGPPGDLQPDHRADRRGRFPAAGDGADPAHPDPGLLRAATIRAISGWRSAPTPISPPDPPLCRPHRPPRAGPRLRARRGRADRRGGGGDGGDRRAHLATSSGGRWWPSARRWTAMSPPICPSRSATLVDCRITGVQPFGFFATVEELGGDGLVPVVDARRRIFPLRRGEPEPDRRGERRALSALGQRLKLRLAEANPVSGGLRFELPDGQRRGAGPAPAAPRRAAGGAARRDAAAAPPTSATAAANRPPRPAVFERARRPPAAGIAPAADRH